MTDDGNVLPSVLESTNIVSAEESVPLLIEKRTIARYIDPAYEDEEAEAGLDVVAPSKQLSTIQLAGMTFLVAIGGPYGLESCVKHGGPLVTIIFTLVLPWVWCLPTTLCAAELSCSIPSNAGQLMWINVALPNVVTLMITMWTIFLSFVDNALYPSMAAKYLENFTTYPKEFEMVIKGGVVVFCAVLNISGVEIVGMGSIVLMVLMLAPFVGQIVVFYTGTADGSIAPRSVDWQAVSHVPSNIDWAAFLPMLTWNLAGLENCGNLAEEVRDPGRSFPRALYFVILLTWISLVLPIIYGVSVQPDIKEWKNGYFTKLARETGGESLEILMLIGSMCSCVGSTITRMATASRALAGMAHMGCIPGHLGHMIASYHPRLGTPVLAITINAVILLIFALFLPFQELVSVDQILYVLRVTVVYVAFVVLRVKFPTLKRIFNYPGPLWVAIVGVSVAGLYNLGMAGLSITGDKNILGMTVGTIGGSFFIAFGTLKYWNSKHGGRPMLRGHIEVQEN